MMKVMVIGSGGYIGHRLILGLRLAGSDCLCSSSTDGSGIDPGSGLLPEGFAIPSGTTSVVYLAQSPRYRHVPEQASHVLAVNTLSAVRAATAARTAGVTRFIYVSTGTVYAPSFNPVSEDAPVRRDNWYALSKLHGEEALALFRQVMEVIVVRPFGVYGPGQQGRLVPNLIDSVANKRAIKLQPRPGVAIDDGGLRISLCYIDDVIRIILQLIQHGGPDCLNLAGREVLSIRSMAEAMGAQIGCNPIFEFSCSNRDTDLVADVTRLEKLVPTCFTSFQAGLSSVLKSHTIR